MPKTITFTDEEIGILRTSLMWERGKEITKIYYASKHEEIATRTRLEKIDILKAKLWEGFVK